MISFTGSLCEAADGTASQEKQMTKVADSSRKDDAENGGEDSKKGADAVRERDRHKVEKLAKHGRDKFDTDEASD